MIGNKTTPARLLPRDKGKAETLTDRIIPQANYLPFQVLNRSLNQSLNRRTFSEAVTTRVALMDHIICIISFLAFHKNKNCVNADVASQGMTLQSSKMEPIP
ncbi:hypothetical protein C241_05152 [Bradyrhizobium lupini HPC(L)]|uniref:Transposase n=1 Tax=Bradyrhizobium lupini HPC(L) TaxID=1229491 RepID=A0ABP2RVI0_RHILU|nr:hypothetical protein C241_05152 [Bradyrhizobium lupini HPC(L)]